MDPELQAMLAHEIGVEPYSSQDAWGAASYGSLTSYRCRVENRRRKVIGRDGQEVISESRIYLATTDQIGINDRITMPSGYLPQHPEIISVKREADEWGAYATTIYV